MTFPTQPETPSTPGQAQLEARLRGSLIAQGLGARGLEKLARNPACTRLQVLTALGLRPATVLRDVYQEASPQEQSPFAIGAGNRFEERLFSGGAAVLVELYRQAGRLPAGEVRVASSGLGGQPKPEQLARWRAQTLRLLQQKLAGHPHAPHLIIKPRLRFRCLGGEHEIEPDGLVAGEGEPFYRVVEIKAYADRDGKTNTSDLKSACRQAAVGIFGLRRVLTELGQAAPEALVSLEADLVLRLPDKRLASLRPMTLEGEVDSLERSVGQDLDLAAIAARVSPDALDSPQGLEKLPCAYRASCHEHCALASRCRTEASRRGDPAILGDAAKELLAPIASLPRALELMHGRGAPPRDEAERALAERLQRGLVKLKEAVHG